VDGCDLPVWLPGDLNPARCIWPGTSARASPALAIGFVGGRRLDPPGPGLVEQRTVWVASPLSAAHALPRIVILASGFLISPVRPTRQWPQSLSSERTAGAAGVAAAVKAEWLLTVSPSSWRGILDRVATTVAYLGRPLPRAR